jgi:glycine cleavage system transcriptional repressor
MALNIRRVEANHYALALIGADRPGIVAAVAGGLSELGCNLEDVTTSLLRGHFAMVLEFSAPAGAAGGGAGAEAIRRHLQARTAALDVHLDVWPVAASEPEGAATHVLRLHGPDRIGIVAAIADVLARHGANIRDMSCSRDDAGAPTYVVVVEVDVPAQADEQALVRALRSAAGELGLRLVVERISQEAF